MAKIVKASGARNAQRLRSQMFAELQSHYLFDDRFSRPGKGNDKSLPRTVARQSGWEHSDNQDGHFGGRGERMIVAARR